MARLSQTGPERDFARIWRAAEKIVYSRTLPAVCLRYAVLPAEK